ncbi:polymeric immunoglobulin receptor-like isoform X1 [Salarias fasciatus]|uniref:polymeric immunoglobulin receptor-like isoform X1 n=1 Tax=Salarias fasciatus TaxID=181472 RepID=UPI0011770643|nr:polymeric immunoglobulin receptor-like isoform X1 [Salarias fasciatus]
MPRRRTLLILLCISAGCVTGTTGLIKVFGYLGGDVNVTCPYDPGYENYEKYLCKNKCEDNDVLITTTDNKNVRFSISDKKNIAKFLVTISNVTASDAGKYWCGVTRTGKDLYQEVKIQLRKDSCCSDVVKTQSHEEGSVSVTCPYAAEHQTNLKYICRGSQPSTCLQRAVVTSERTSDPRFTLTDDQMSRKFTVTISQLARADSGQYLCGVRSDAGLDVFSAVQLEVKEWCCVASSNVTGTEGHSVTLQCPYPPQHQHNRKFLCKGDRRNNCTDVVKNRSRFTLQDDISSSTFSVTVSELEAGDAGTYWCASHSQWRVGNYTKLQLSVFLQRDSVIPPFTGTTLIVGFSVIPVVLMLIFTLVMFRLKCHKRREAEVFVFKNQPGPANVEETRPNVCSNQDFVGKVKQSSCYNYDNDREDQPEYGNITRTDEIYCNQEVFRVHRK